MVKIRTYDIFITDNDKVIFGNDFDSELFWDNLSQELRLTSTISGVDPIQNYHLTTKYYVDQGDIDDFLELTDTPTAYSGASHKFVRVKEDETGLYFENAIVGVTSTGTVPPEDSNLWYNANTNEFYYYDYSRNEWLTLNSVNYLYSYQGNISGLYLSVGDVRHSYAHNLIPRPATICLIIASCEQKQNPSTTIELRDGRYSPATASGVITSFNLSNWEYFDDAADVDLTAGTKLQAFVTTSGTVSRNPIVTVQIRWRYEV